MGRNILDGIPKNPVHFRQFTFLYIFFRTFCKTNRLLLKLIGWFREIAKYSKVTPINAGVFGTPIPAGERAKMQNAFSSNNLIYIKLSREDHYNN